MATRLGIYNEALRAIGELRLTSLTEDLEARYVLDDAWADAVEYVFTEGLWNFATVTQSITYDVGITPIPGFSFGFAKPDGWVRTITISPNSLFDVEANYRDEGGRIFANYDTLYIRYISNAKSGDEFLTEWPPSFASVVAARLASECAKRITGSDGDAETLKKDYKDALATAKNKDALDQSKVVFRPGNWVRAMRGSSVSRDRGPLSGY